MLLKIRLLFERYQWIMACDDIFITQKTDKGFRAYAIHTPELLYKDGGRFTDRLHS